MSRGAAVPPVMKEKACLGRYEPLCFVVIIVGSVQAVVVFGVSVAATAAAAAVVIFAAAFELLVVSRK